MPACIVTNTALFLWPDHLCRFSLVDIGACAGLSEKVPVVGTIPTGIRRLGENKD